MKWAIFRAVVAIGVSALGTAVHGEDSKAAPAAQDRIVGKVERADKLIRRDIRNARGQRIGRVEDLAVDLDSGRVLYAIVGGLPKTSRRVAVPPTIFREQNSRLISSVDPQTLINAPQFDRDQASRLETFSCTRTASAI